MHTKIIGYTTGVFDMFHIGHLNILHRAKQHCDYLIVGVSTDELCQSYKHKKPIVPYEERKSIVMFVGDDWKNSTLFNELETQFQKVGVSIQYFPYTQGTSSSELREKLNKIE